MEKQISIIIPTYNMEKYLGKCLDSLLIPEFDQVEVLVVNDGSKDRSSEIAHGYADRYPDNIRVIDKPNGNYGSCVNAALPLASGRYVKILDADDTFDTKEFSQFVNLLSSIDDDVILTPYVIVNENGEITSRKALNCYGIELDQTHKFNDLLDSALDQFTAMHQIAYKTEIFKRFNYHQTEGISHTDIQWAIVPLSYADTLRFTEIYVYKYLIGREGQTMDPKQRAKSIEQVIQMNYELVRIYEKTTLDSVHSDYMLKQVLRQHKSVFLGAIGNIWTGAMDKVKNYDLLLKEHNNVFFNALSVVKYDKNSSFCFINDIRKKNYPINYKIPFWVLFEISLKLRVKKALGK